MCSGHPLYKETKIKPPPAIDNYNPGNRGLYAEPHRLSHFERNPLYVGQNNFQAALVKFETIDKDSKYLNHNLNLI